MFDGNPELEDDDPREDEHDMEAEVGELVPHYGIDQTAGAIGWGTIGWARA